MQNFHIGNQQNRSPETYLMIGETAEINFDTLCQEKNEVELFQTLFVKCDICDTKLSCKETLRIHMRIHFGEKKEICNICSKTFLTKVNLSQHMRYHFQAFKKDHECGVCGYKTHEKSILRRHLQIHDGVKYKCNVCSQMCNTEISLKGHMKSKHMINRKSYNCEICEKSFNSTGSVYNHLKTHDQNIVKKSIRISGYRSGYY